MNAATLKHNKWIRRAFAVVMVILAVWLVAWIAVPPILKSQLQKIGSEKLGRKVSVGSVDFKPWTLELTLHDVRIASADGSQPQVQIARVYADAALQSVLRLTPIVDAVSIDSPVIKLTHFVDGKYDIDDILAKLASAPEKPKSEPQKFAIYNIVVSGGSVDFNDEQVQHVQQLRDLTLHVPFLSNLASKRNVTTEPKLAFVLNGSKFDSTTFTTPFADNRKTEVQFNLKGLDLAPYLGYVPTGLPVQLQAATLDADMKVAFEQGATTGLKITGVIEAHNAKVADAGGGDLLGFDSLKLDLADVRPLEKIVHLSAISLAGPKFSLVRDAAGKLNLLPASTDHSAKAKVPVVAAAAAPASASVVPPKAADTSDWHVQVDTIALHGGDISWKDQTIRPAAAVDVSGLDIEAHTVTWPMNTPATFNGNLSLQGAAVRFKGTGTDQLATVQAEVDALPLSVAASYLAQSLEPTLNGKLSGQVDIDWKKAETGPELRVKANRVLLADLALATGKTALASVGKVELTDAEVDLTRHTLAVGAFTVTQPKVQIERDAEKRWMYERWLRMPTTGAPVVKAASTNAVAGAGASAAPWKLSIATFAVNGGTVSYADRASQTPAAFDITALNVQAQKIALGTATEMPLQVSGRIGAGRRADPGRFDFKGKLVLKPLAVEGQLEASAIPVHAFKSYFQDGFNNIDVRRAFLGYKGSVRYADAPGGLSLKLAADTSLEDFHANSSTLTQAAGIDSSNELLSWKALGLRGLQLTLAPGAAPVVNVRETSLTDFFARVIVDETGHLNLQNLTKAATPNKVAPAAAPASVAVASAPAAITTEPLPGGGTATTRAPSTVESGGAKPVIRFGPITLVNGKVDFTDNFVKPNYSADLTELTGKLSAFSSIPVDGALGMADLELRGKAQQTAALEILGKINPLGKPLVLDITAKMTNLDLPPLSPYAVRYAGHGIERGKLSMEVNYVVKPDGQLTASNKLVLNQLRFGDEVPGAPNSLPVRLAVALLADRNGVINVDLPLSGSLNDPQFSVGPLIFKAIVNLIAKAAVAPFALLTGGFGGDSGESSVIAFAPGSAVLSAAAKENLDKVAKALVNRPSLKMTVVGTADLEKERDAYQRQRLRELTQSEKRRIAARGGDDATAVTPVTDAEYPTLLAAVYKRADITKPRNMVGLAKDLPVAEMENLLLASIPANDNAMRELAVARGAAVRDYLLEQKLPAERLFLGAVQTHAEGPKWKPGAELNLATN